VRAATGRGDGARRLGQLVLGASGDGYAAAALPELQGDGATDAVSTAGDEHSLVCQV
jgi:hypothetical protein